MTPYEFLCRDVEAVTGPPNYNGAHRCPAHDDRTPSLSIAEGDNGIPLLHCFAGCSNDQILDALGRTWSDYYDDSNRSKQDAFSAKYAFLDEHDQPEWYEVRLAGPEKKVRSCQLNPDGSVKEWRAGKSRRLYREPEILEAVANDEVIHIVEGCKDTDSVFVAGGIATSCPFGAGRWLPQHSRALRGAGTIVVVPDRDEPGYRHAQYVANCLRGWVCQIIVAEARVGKDITDHLTAGFGLDELVVIGWTEINGCDFVVEQIAFKMAAEALR
jgi:putative DNA primase/helicase